MYLKSMNIIGFKTFADETDLIFDPGFTAVVGPNGSGKSNIVDAIRWVLGEKSAKGLRGEKMDDVIFHGSETRDPAGFSEVSIHLDNSNKIFHIDFPTVKITRRLYPDLTNEYYINNSRSLRKDVEKLLMDTGVGKSSYSIMEQGKVDQILNSKPEDRRAIFDEAAGISRFKQDRIDTEKKLQYTSQNLLRISDIMSTMERELETKEKQAKRAEKYFGLKNDLTEVDKNLRYLKWKSLKNRQKKVEIELLEVSEKNQSIMKKMNDDARLLESFEEKKYEMERKIADIDRKLLDFLSQKEILREKIEKNKSIILEFDKRVVEESYSLENDLQKKEKYDGEKLSLEESLDQVLNGLEDTEKNIQILINRKQNLETELESLRKDSTQNEEFIKENDKNFFGLREELKEIIVSLINQIEERKKEYSQLEEKRKDMKFYLLSGIDEFLNSIQSGSSDSITENKLMEYKVFLQNFIEIEDVFRDIIFDKDGMLSKKEGLDSKIEELIQYNDSLTEKIRENGKNIDDLYVRINEIKEEIVKLEKYILEMNSKKESLGEQKKSITGFLNDTESRIQSSKHTIESINNRKKGFEDEVLLLEEKIESSYTEFLKISKILESEKIELKEILSKILELKNSSGRDQEEFKSLLPLISDLERKSSVLKTQLDSFSEELYNDYSMTDLELESEKQNSTFKQDAEESKLREIKSEIQLLGSINPLAIDEYQSIKEVYEHHRSQKEDIEKSKNDIEGVLKNINLESEKIFLEIFELIRINFQETFSTLFNGGRAMIELTDRNDLLNSGIEIIAEPPGKHVQNLKLLSGGEKSMTVIALLFAIYMVRPSPFCFLDEIDAALDEVNKTRFCQILDKFKDKSQFIVVTHAPPTISRANTIFGVTSEEPGVSKVVSLKMEEAKNFSKHMKEAV
jgi:chromosome segregation protein